MGFIPFFFLVGYVGVFFTLAMAAYAFFKGTRSVERHARVAFWAVLFFGGFGLMGCAIGVLFLLLWFHSNFVEWWKVWVVGSLIYSVSGTSGSWFSLWAIREFQSWNRKQMEGNSETIGSDEWPVPKE